ncbi:MAG: prolyl aminopeptidase [Cellvibrionaceae bacterium]|nr:prolyl aminopeptidase [Cellvibrionaceae bacterium]
MHPLYPSIKPYRTLSLAVSARHTLYLEESGSPDGTPVLFVHGGPGAGCSPQDRRFFDPEKYRIILFDQRGAGRSTPHADLSENTTADLIDDIEKIREHLAVDRWVLFGGSWGSTLSLLYAQQYPERVINMILRGIFLCRQQDIDWFYQRGAHQIFPDYWQDYLQPIPESKRQHMVKAYYELLTGDNELAKMNAAKHWSVWEGRCATLRPSAHVMDTFSNVHFSLSLARIEAHYFIHHAFIEDNQILQNMDKLQDIPATIIHGRYDMICPLDNAVALQRLWPKAKLQIIRDAGHASREPGILDALIQATDAWAHRFDNNA